MFNNLRRIKKVFFVLVAVCFFVFVLSRGHVYGKNELEYGITFSKKQAEALNLNWQEVYLSALNELGVKKVRLPAYWNEVEPLDNEYFWDDLDWLINESEKAEIEIILAIGGRLPRWPECHFPEWIDNFSKEEKEEKMLSYISEVINRYKENKSIIAWQIENEPFLAHFGECPKLDKELLDKEIKLAKSMDNRPIVITDSGELSIWIPAARRADIFGTTMYRDTYSKQLKRYIHYPIAPGFFRFKKNIAGLFAKPDKWVVIELQAEPWGPIPYQYLTAEERGRTMNFKKFREMIEFSSLTGFKEFYLWGVEYWYWEKKVNGDDGIWEEAKILFNMN
ncbi:beta-galactosidase [Patescibacteria group bacterium]|nr:beta-galactosidase [Patescibacteria group bacterium]MBU4600435.1 beta-galactosidase [Patescibacteria group bacterium]MCG2698307.1 beta-galactosidase [Candidatus Parcubacteria bacterium]